MSNRVSCLRCCLLTLGIALCFGGIILTMIGFAIKLKTSRTGCSSCQYKNDDRITKVENCRIAGPTMIVLGIFISAAMCCRGKDRADSNKKYRANEPESAVACSTRSQLGHTGKHYTYSSDSGATNQNHYLLTDSVGQSFGHFNESESFFPIIRQQAYPLITLKQQTLQSLAVVSNIKSSELSSGSLNGPPPPSYTSVITSKLESSNKQAFAL